VGRLGVEHDDREQHHQVGVPIDDRVEECPERRHLAGGTRQRAVEEVAQPREDEEEAAGSNPPGAERGRGQEAHAEPDERQMIRPQMEPPIEREPDRVDPAAHGLTVAAEHRQIG
jgi:hypothetical protein